MKDKLNTITNNDTIIQFEIVKSTTYANKYIENAEDKEYIQLLKSLKKEQLYALILKAENFKQTMEVVINETKNEIKS